MSFRDLDDFLVTQPIELPIRGKVYRFPGSISARAGLVIRRLAETADETRRAQAEGREVDSAREVLGDDAEVDLRREMMTLDGHDVEQEMVDDGLTTAHVQHVFQTLLVWHMAGREAAEAAWEQMAGDPPVPNRAERRKGSSGSANGTPSPASTSGTKAPRASSKDKVPARRGGTSSPAGT